MWRFGPAWPAEALVLGRCLARMARVAHALKVRWIVGPTLGSRRDVVDVGREAAACAHWVAYQDLLAQPLPVLAVSSGCC